MAVLTTGNTFSNGDQVTASSLNNAVNNAEFAAGAVDGISTQLSGTNPQQIIVKDLGISRGKIAIDAVGTDQLANDVVVNTSGSITGAAGSFTTLAASGVVSVPDGSESVPSITNTGDTNTGIYFPAENSVALTAGAGARLTCSTSAITIDRPTTIVSTAQSELTLQGGDANSKNLIFKKASAQQGKIAAVGDELKFYAGTSGTETLELTTTGAVVTGNLGIGTASPDELLHIKGGSDRPLVVESTDAFCFISLNDNSTSAQSAVMIGAQGDDLRIDAGDSERIRVESNGNVGIGTPSPGRLLTVAGDAEFNVVGSSNTSKGIVINSSGTNFESDDGIIQATHAGSGSLTGGYWLKFNANSADKFTVRGDGRTEISSTTGGVILPRMSTSNRTSISSPANGEMVYDTDLNKFYGYANGAWVALH